MKTDLYGVKLKKSESEASFIDLRTFAVPSSTRLKISKNG